uniref:Uncharacterized protein n=1 Tax=Arundo donax TaxID=35708 RepID=A0A0A9S9L2_ARUDO
MTSETLAFDLRVAQFHYSHVAYWTPECLPIFDASWIPDRRSDL